LSTTTAPAVHFYRATTSVDEDTGTATITVARAGDPGPAVRVGYTTHPHTATPGGDYTPTSGTLSFAAGATEESFTVRIRNDHHQERRETLLLALRSPTGGAVIGTRRSTALTIRRSDQRPDLWIRTPDQRYIGNNIYNTTGNRQTKTRTARRSQTRTFYARITNDGTNTNILTLHAGAARTGSRIRYSRGNTNVTAALRSREGLRVRVRAYGDYRRIKIHTTIRDTATIGSWQPATFTATWNGDSTRTDRIKAAVKATRRQ
jgi:hypothetical protein